MARLHHLLPGHLLAVGLVAGLAAGTVATLLQAATVVPLILQAEALEPHHAAEHSAAARSAATWLFNSLAGTGFGLLLAAGYNLRAQAGLRAGLLWGLGGFVAFYLAPALGLPPSLPGTELAGLGARQAWWLATAAATAAGLTLVVFGSRLWMRGCGLALVALPHLAGAPQLDTVAVGPPQDLMRAFAAWSAVANALFWLVLGAVSGWLFQRFTMAGADRR
ncbi:MAG TPA: CbtA family protein [Burkholderiales bacterium]|jgi:cobalt transporter subunit CbtA